MAEEIHVEEFLIDLPNQVAQAQCQLFASNVNVAEFWSRRLSDFLTVLNVLHQRFIETEETEDIQDANSLFTSFANIIQEVQSLWRRFEDILCDNYIPHLIEHECEIEESSNHFGRPRKKVEQAEVERLYDIYRSWEDVAKQLGVSVKTLQRRRVEFGLDISGSSAPHENYTKISQQELCYVIGQILNVLPNAGESYVVRACRSHGIYVQRRHIREGILEVDPVSCALRRTVSIVRRTYNVKAPNALWLITFIFDSPFLCGLSKSI